MTAVDQNLYLRAKYHVLFDRKASTSYIQRKLQIGYNAAAALMEKMEAEGVIGPANHVGKRDIFMGPPSATEEPPWETPQAETAPVEASAPADPEPQPQAPPEAAPSPKADPGSTLLGRMISHKCSSCNVKGFGPEMGLPDGWYERASKFGRLITCAKCSEPHAVRIATTHMTTEEIMTADGANDVITGAAQSRLRTIIERAGRVLEDISAAREDLKEVFSEAKGEGFDVKIIRKLMSELQKDPAKRREEQELLDIYAAAIGETL